MKKTAWLVSTLLLVGLAPALVDCGAVDGLAQVPGAEAVGKLAGGAIGGCPDTTSAEAAAKFDYAGGFSMDAEAGAKLKAGLASAIEIKGFSARVDADLKVACSGLAKDLDAPGEYPTGNDACKAAAKALGNFKAKLGASAKVAIDIKPPACQASMNVMADCAAKCDVNVKPGEAKVECEPGKLSGSCSGQCSGQCDLKAAAKCSGTCSGSCDAQMAGSCSGKCNGKCDGKPSNGATCTGTCDGKCDGSMQGDCQGKCGGSCKLNAEATCDGTCTGSCKGEMKAPSCTGEMKPPQMSADCRAKCDTQVQANATCTPASVGVKIQGAADAKAAEKFKLAVERNLPGVLKVAIGLGEQSVRVAGRTTEVVDGLQASVKTMVKGDAQTVAAVSTRLVGCVGAPFKDAITAAASLKANVSVSVEVKASASGSVGGQTN